MRVNFVCQKALHIVAKQFQLGGINSGHRHFLSKVEVIFNSLRILCHLLSNRYHATALGQQPNPPTRYTACRLFIG